MSDWLYRYWSTIVAVTASLVALTITALKMFGIDKTLPGGPETYLSGAMLLIVIAVHFNVLSLVARQQAANTEISRLRIDVTKAGVHFCERVDANEFYNQFIKMVQSARKSVDLTNLDDVPLELYQIRNMKVYFSTLVGLVRANPQIHFRRIVSIPSHEKWDWVKNMIEEVKDCANMSIQLVRADHSAPMPPISFQIVDKERVLIVDPETSLMRPTSLNNLLIEGIEASACFALYYDRFWKTGKPLKDGLKINYSLLEEARAELTTSLAHA
jgi:hypothetical protein